MILQNKSLPTKKLAAGFLLSTDFIGYQPISSGSAVTIVNGYLPVVSL